MDKIVILITAVSQQEAGKIAQALLRQRKAACVNIVPSINSLFWWEGKIESAQESLLIVKTKRSLFGQVVNIVKEIHSYQVPEIIALPIVDGNQDYLNWLDNTCH